MRTSDPLEGSTATCDEVDLFKLEHPFNPPVLEQNQSMGCTAAWCKVNAAYVHMAYAQGWVFRGNCGLIIVDCGHFEAACAQRIFTFKA